MALKRAFRILYRSGLALSRALERIEAEVDNLLAAELVEFIAGSKRGIAGYVGGRARDRDADD
jgi:acyl-[acyl carrier protein]--UDP-N-acetylglucosamine O-acyltransferase